VINFFQREGWAYVPSLFSAVEVPPLIQAFDRVVQGVYETGRAPHGVDKFANGSLAKISNAWLADHTIAGMVLNPRIGKIAAELLGVEEIYLWADSLYWKGPYADTEQAVIGWHQDKHYWPISSTEKMITCCVALYEADARSGGLRFASGSHRWGLIEGTEAWTEKDNTTIHERPRAPEGEEWSEICPLVLPGGATFHHSLTFHGSGRNLTPFPRRSVTIHMVAGEGRLVNWEPVKDGYLEHVGLGNPFRGPLFPRLWPNGLADKMHCCCFGLIPDPECPEHGIP